MGLPARTSDGRELGRKLAALEIDRGTYADVKDPACDVIMVAAEAWASQTGWDTPINMRIFTEVGLDLSFACPASAGPVSF